MEKNAGCLVIGAGGLVGARVASVLGAGGFQWTGTCHKRGGEGLIELDITDAAQVDAVLGRVAPNVVLHCANLAGGVDFCEKNPDAAQRFHLEAVGNVGTRCRDIKATFVFISTDYVFDGAKAPYGEDDKPNPLNAYGRLKLAAERWIEDNLERYVIVRTTNVFGWDPKTVTPNYIMGLYRTLSDGKQFNAPSFLRGNPTYVGDLAGALLELAFKDARGIYNVVGPSNVDRYEWARRACGPLGLDVSLVMEKKYPPPDMIPRPMNSCLNTQKFTSSNGTALHGLDEGMRLMAADRDARRGTSGLEF
jgi:dTDP-4-dehydrorhamnose reductase